MASLYRRKRSPFFWIKYYDAAGELRQESTRLRYDRPSEARQARELQRELTQREQTRKESGAIGGEAWQAWVPRFIAQRYAASSLTLQRVLGAWRNLEAFMRAKEVFGPRQLNRQQIRDFIEWRQQAHPALGVHKAAKNTALLEVKFLGVVIAEAMESGFCTHNPCLKLGIERDAPKRKPEITEEEHRRITRALKGEAEWMRVSYKIAWEQGCRFSETCVELEQVDLARNVIGLRTKGQKESVAEVPISPRLRPMLRRLKGELSPAARRVARRLGLRVTARKRTFEVTKLPDLPGKIWWRFFRKVGLPHLSFHSTRVSFITRCHRRGIPQELVMRLCLHASETVHQIYPRLPAQSDHLQAAIRKAAA